MTAPKMGRGKTGIERNGVIIGSYSGLMLTKHCQGPPQRDMTKRIVYVQANCGLGGFLTFGEFSFAVFASHEYVNVLAKRETGMGGRKCRVEFSRPAKKLQTPCHFFRFELVGVPHSALIVFPGIETFRRLAQRTLAFAGQQLRLDGAYDRTDNFILDREDIL